jgi:hypothetical protein
MARAKQVSESLGGEDATMFGEGNINCQEMSSINMVLLCPSLLWVCQPVDPIPKTAFNDEPLWFDVQV